MWCSLQWTQGLKGLKQLKSNHLIHWSFHCSSTSPLLPSQVLSVLKDIDFTHPPNLLLNDTFTARHKSLWRNSLTSSSPSTRRSDVLQCAETPPFHSMSSSWEGTSANVKLSSDEDTANWCWCCKVVWSFWDILSGRNGKERFPYHHAPSWVSNQWPHHHNAFCVGVWQPFASHWPQPAGAASGMNGELLF